MYEDFYLIKPALLLEAGISSESLLLAYKLQGSKFSGAELHACKPFSRSRIPWAMLDYCGYNIDWLFRTCWAVAININESSPIDARILARICSLLDTMLQ